MSKNHHSWMSDWKVGLRLWVERLGQPILGPGRLELLEWIERCRSISAAARQMGMSYRRAWLLVESINKAAGMALVETKTGGTRGGGAVLTDQGRLAITAFRALQGRLRARTVSLLPQVLPGAAREIVHVAAAVSLEEVVGQLAIDFALGQPMIQIRAIYGGSDELTEHILGGADVNVFLSADVSELKRLKTAGLIEEKWELLAQNTLAVIAVTDWPHTFRKPADLLKPEIVKLAVAEPSCPLGRYTQGFLEKERLLRALKDRLVFADNARAVIAGLRAGIAPLGVIYSSDAGYASGCRLLFRIQQDAPVIEYHAALVHGQAGAEAGRRFLKYLGSPQAGVRFRQCGFMTTSKEKAARDH
jgi:molybdenum ABC transporter molybdate-binding protein